MLNSAKLNNISDEELKSNFNKIVCGLSDLIKNNKESLIENKINPEKIDEELYTLEQKIILMKI